MNQAFQTTIPGKWVLAGEHAVLRGGSAVALPRHDISLALHFEPDATKTGVEIDPVSIRAVVSPLIDELIARLRHRHVAMLHPPRGKLKITSTIPIGAGLGSSAALCLALVRWATSRFELSTHEQIEWATALENRFHGRSSGMDVTVAALGAPIRFFQGPKYEILPVAKIPQFQFIDTGLRSKTSECIALVKALETRNPSYATALDCQMKLAAETAAEALVEFNSGPQGRALERLANSMRNAQECYEGWGLVPERVKELADAALRAGALAVKLTGAGNGGFLVSLWPQ